MKKIVIILFIYCCSVELFAQPANLDSVKQELYKVNKVFDSSRYIGFNVHIKYASDTVYGVFEHDEMNGQYILSDRNVYYRMGNIEYVQNDSFSYDIYHDEKMMVMTRDTIGKKSTLFPLREFVDSMLTIYATAYTINFGTENESKMIEFTTLDTSVPYGRFAIYYEPTTYYPDRIEMNFVEIVQPDSLDVDIPSYRTLTMRFSDYYNPSSLDVFADSNYVFFDRQRKRYRPSDKFRMYRFISQGIERTIDGTIEEYPLDEGQ